MRGKPYDEKVMIRTTSRQATVGLGALGVSMICCVILVADFVHGGHQSACVVVDRIAQLVLDQCHAEAGIVGLGHEKRSVP